jgi:ubiquinone/menaquinone biosynthesis C-methylase UbiE
MRAPMADERPASPLPLRAEYAALARSYDTRWAAYLEHSLGLLRPALQSQPPRRVLDLACGTGALLPRLRRWAGAEVTWVGVDSSPEMLLRAATAADPRAGALCAAAEALPFAGGSFDTVVCASALHYFAEPARVLAEARRVLLPGGRLLLLDWAGDALAMRLLAGWLRLRRRPLARLYRSADAAELVRDAGFVVDRVGRGSAPPCWRLFLIEARVESPPDAPASAEVPRS